MCQCPIEIDLVSSDRNGKVDPNLRLIQDQVFQDGHVHAVIVFPMTQIGPIVRVRQTHDLEEGGDLLVIGLFGSGNFVFNRILIK